MLQKQAEQNLCSGAGDEARTRDIQLGRLKLYQLSYSRTLPYNPLLKFRKSPEKFTFSPKILEQYSRRKPCSLLSIPSRQQNLLHTTRFQGWWWGEDLNLRRLRRQIYSLFPLATREPHPDDIWSQRQELNPRHPHYK